MEKQALIERVASLIRKAEQADKADDAMKFSQAAVNAGNALAVLREWINFPIKVDNTAQE